VSELTVSPVGEGERSAALDTLVLAFAADPVERWLYPQADRYLEVFPQFLVAFGGRRLGFAVTSQAQAGSCRR
jgi:hypothetical protein